MDIKKVKVNQEADIKKHLETLYKDMWQNKQIKIKEK